MEHKFRNSTRPVYYKSLALDVKADSETRKVSGYLASFGTKDLDGDILIKGCFAKSLSEHGPASNNPRKIAFLWQHDMDEPLGQFTTLIEDDKGLYFEADIDLIPKGDEVLTQYASGTLNQHSIGFRYIWDKLEWDDKVDEGRGAFIVKEVELFEGSVVTIGSNENTPFTGFKAPQLESIKNKLTKDTEKLLKTLPSELAYEIRQLIAKHISLNETEPVKEPLHVEEPKVEAIDFTKIINHLKLT